MSLTSRSVAASAARTTNGNSNALQAIGSLVSVTANVTAVSGTTPSMTLSMQWSVDGVNFGPADPADTFTAITATGVVAKSFATRAPFYRVAWAITGTTPSFTFTLDSLESGA